jgi:hypothetical protein
MARFVFDATDGANVTTAADDIAATKQHSEKFLLLDDT